MTVSTSSIRVAIPTLYPDNLDGQIDAAKLRQGQYLIADVIDAESNARAAAADQVLADAQAATVVALNSAGAELVGRPVEALASFGVSGFGLPETYSAFAGLMYGSDAVGPYVRRSADVAASSVFLRAVSGIPGNDHVFRVTAKVRAVGATFPARFIVHFLNSAGATVAGGSYLETTATDGEVVTMAMTFGRLAGGLVTVPGGNLTTWDNTDFIRVGVRNQVAAPGASFDVLELRVEDVTSADQAARQAAASVTASQAAEASATDAAGSATSAAGSASNAGTSATNAANAATDAGQQASAAQTAASNAGQQASAAQTAASNASASATDAGQQASAAAGSANTATSAAAIAGASIYATTAAGIAATSSGGYFYVPAQGQFIAYLQNAGVAVEVARIGQPVFADRAGLVSAVAAGYSPPVGTVIFAGGLSYVKVSGSTDLLGGLPGWESAGAYTPEHFGAIGDGVDNCEGSNFRYDWLTAASYEIGDRVQAPSNRRGYVCLSAHTSDDFNTDLAAGRWQIGQFFGTDDRPAFERALQTGRPVHLMPGKRYVWREPAGNATSPGTPFVDLTASKPDIHIIGAPDAWILMDEDVAQRLADGNGTASFGIDTGVMTAPERGKYGVCRFENLNVRSRWSHYPGTNLDDGPNGSGFNWCRIEGYQIFEVTGGTYEDFRQKVSRNRHNGKVRIINTNGFRLAKGMWREVNPSDVIATGNHIDGSGDDCLDFIHVESDLSNPDQGPGSWLVMSNNIIKNSENMQSQGFSQVTICDNILDRMVSDAISASVGNVSANERPRTAIKVTGNIITNTMMPWDNAAGEIGVAVENSSILVRGGRRTQFTTSAYPGAYDATAGAFVLPYDYLQTVKRSQIESSAGGFLIDVSENQILRNLPVGVNYADWGYGWMYSPSGFVNPVVSEANFLTAGVGLANDINGAVISSNQTLGVKFPVRLRETNSLDVQRAFDNIIIDGNVCIDCVQGFSHTRSGGSTQYRWNVTVSNNVFDCDPFFRSANRTVPLDGSWVSEVSSLTGECGIQARNLPNLKAFGNTFRNCYTPIISNTVGSPARNNVIGNNTVECWPVAREYSSGNKGVAIPCSGADFAHVIVDSDPTSETYGNVVNIPQGAYSSRPASGIYVQGWFSRNTSGASLGWMRITTGAGHTLGTDWREVA